MQIPSEVSGVRLQFAPEVVIDVNDALVAALTQVISNCAAKGLSLQSLWISSAKDQHRCPSRHVSGLAVDISRVNGVRIGQAFGIEHSLTATVMALQNCFELAPGCRENFGPALKMKCGRPKNIKGHEDHIHWSIDGDHSECTRVSMRALVGVLTKLIKPAKRDELCNL